MKSGLYGDRRRNHGREMGLKSYMPWEKRKEKEAKAQSNATDADNMVTFDGIVQMAKAAKEKKGAILDGKEEEKEKKAAVKAEKGRNTGHVGPVEVLILLVNVPKVKGENMAEERDTSETWKSSGAQTGMGRKQRN